MKKSDLTKAIEHHRKNEFKKAEKLYLKILKERSTQAETLSNANANLGSLYYQLQNSDEAIIHLKKAIFLNPTHTNALNNLALVYIRLDDNEQVIQTLNKVLALDPII